MSAGSVTNRISLELACLYRHREARSAVAIHRAVPLDCHAPSGLAMTGVEEWVRGRTDV
ncbi:hypothetical protein [Inquilinus limosus]|uniref:hypothetical protein n=1 Tax=Inquilinus limosus TaxID=171674 RepID=UPI0015C61429|nr:hypothetical protein [Inquilinus limosus]